MRSSSLFLAATTVLAATVSAAPTFDWINNVKDVLTAATTSCTNNQQAKPVQPQSTLPPPTGELKWIALGLGTQNYSCGSDPTAPPKAVGATANLYDLTHWFQTNIAQSHSDFAYKMVPCAADATQNSFGLTQMGIHFFTGAGTPTFQLNMNGYNALLSAAKKSAMNAPSDACKGRSGAAAVPWLYLADAGGSTGVSSVYRLETAGGSAPATCDGYTGQQFQVDYAAEYWFY